MSEETQAASGEGLKSDAPSPKVLTRLEFEQLENGRLRRELLEKELLLADMKRERVADQKKILDLMIQCQEIDRRNIQAEKDSTLGKLRALKAPHDEVKREICVRLGIEPGTKFGYDPDTLEIVL